MNMRLIMTCAIIAMTATSFDLFGIKRKPELLDGSGNGQDYYNPKKARGASAALPADTVDTVTTRRAPHPLGLETLIGDGDDKRSSFLPTAFPSGEETNHEETKDEARDTRVISSYTASGLTNLTSPAAAPAKPIPAPFKPLDYPDDGDDIPTPLPAQLPLPTPTITAHDVPTLIAQMQELITLGHTPEAIGAAIKASGFDINGIRIGHYDTIGRKCALTGEAIQNWWRGGWRDLEKQDNGMNALQWAIFNNRRTHSATPVLPNAEKIILALLTGGALPTIKVNAGRIFKGDAATNHGLDALELALEHGSHETVCMMLKNHPNLVPVINHYVETRTGWHDILLFALVKSFPAAVIRQLFVSGAVTPTHINRVFTDAAPNDELSWLGVPVQYRKTPMTPICLACWFEYDQAERLNVIRVLAEYGADRDPRWTYVEDPRGTCMDEYSSAWLEGKAERERKKSCAAARPVLNALTYGDLRPTGGDSRFNPTATSHSGPITNPAVRILPEAVTNLITDYI